MLGWEPLYSSNRQTFHHQEYVDAGAPSDADAGVKGRDADADVQVVMLMLMFKLVTLMLMLMFKAVMLMHRQRNVASPGFPGCWSLLL